VSNLTPYPDQAADREAAQGPPDAAFRYASWGRRAGALLLDSLIIAVGFFVVFALAFAVVTADETAGAIAIILAVIVAIAGSLWYYIYLVGKDGQTIARRWLGIRVVDGTSGEAIGYGRAAGRYFITFVFGFFTIPLIVDYLWPLWDSRNQTLHDKVVSSIVIRL
jgi:uncharacterized RDD family membrane protein YckC